MEYLDNKKKLMIEMNGGGTKWMIEKCKRSIYARTSINKRQCSVVKNRYASLRLLLPELFR